MMSEDKEILTQKDLYEYFPLGKTTIQKMLQQKIIPATRSAEIISSQNQSCCHG